MRRTAYRIGYSIGYRIGRWLPELLVLGFVFYALTRTP